MTRPVPERREVVVSPEALLEMDTETETEIETGLGNDPKTVPGAASADRGEGGGGERGRRTVNVTNAALVTDFVSEPGCGVSCGHPLGRVCVGTRSWAESDGGRRRRGKKVAAGADQGSASLEAADAVMRRLEMEGKTSVIVTVDGEAVGVIAVADTDKEVGGRLGG